MLGVGGHIFLATAIAYLGRKHEMKFSRFLRVSAAAAVFAGVATTVASVGATEAGAAAKDPITIAYISSLTGLGASQDGGSQNGFLARVALQNAMGGVNGHKIVPLVIDDQTSPSIIATAVQDAISKGAVGIVSQSPLFFLAAKYPQQAGVPVTGSYDDGVEWGQQPYTNMFASDHGSVDPKIPVNTLLGAFVKKQGAKVIGSYGYGISPASAASARGNAASFKAAGGKVGVLDTSIPFGGTNFTTAALVAKKAGIDSYIPSMDNNSNYALATALKQAGVKVKASLYATGYQPDVIGSPVWKTLQGSYFLSYFRPTSLPNAATKQLVSAMTKYGKMKSGQFPTFGDNEAYVGADLMLQGIKMSGANPTRANVIKNLRSIKAYNANGLLPITNNYTNNFGKDPLNCSWIMKATTTGFVAVSSNPICGHDIPGTTTVSGS
jgi:branched-chain amino acid transport system substrate-binding protein